MSQPRALIVDDEPDIRELLGITLTRMELDVCTAANLDEAYRLLIRGDLHLVVHDGEHLDRLLAIAERFATVIPLHLEIDTGMGRGGCAAEEAGGIAGRIAEHRWLRLAGVSTHFAKAGADAKFTDRQLGRFETALDACAASMPDDCLVHAANTLATLRHLALQTPDRIGNARALQRSGGAYTHRLAFAEFRAPAGVAEENHARRHGHALMARSDGSRPGRAPDRAPGPRSGSGSFPRGAATRCRVAPGGGALLLPHLLDHIPDFLHGRSHLSGVLTHLEIERTEPHRLEVHCGA